MANIISEIFPFDIRILTAFLATIGLFLCILRYRQNSLPCSNVNLPPGPCGWPRLGYLPDMAIARYRSGKHPHQLLSDLSQQYGKVYSIYIGTRHVVILNDFGAIKEAFQNANICDRRQIAIWDDLGLEQGVASANGEAWKQQRRFTLGTLKNFGVGKTSFEEKIFDETNELIKEISSIKDQPFDPCHLFSNAVSNIICSVVLGRRFQYSDAHFQQLLHMLNKQVQLYGISTLHTLFPFLSFVQPGIYEQVKANFHSLIQFIEAIVDEHRENHDANDPSDYIDVFLNEIELNKKLHRVDSHLNHSTLLTTIVNIFGAGSETTATTLRWAVLYMIANPRVQSNVHKEIDSVVGQDRLPRMSDKDFLPYTEATLLEIQRISSILPLGLMHIAKDRTTLQGYTIPKGSMVISNLYAVHNDSKVWDNPEEFNPLRFIDENGCVRKRDELIPFSTGRRVCIGEHLAKMELFIFFTHLLHQFTFKKPDASPPLSLKGEVGFTNSPGPFCAQFQKRH